MDFTVITTPCLRKAKWYKLLNTFQRLATYVPTFKLFD